MLELWSHYRYVPAVVVNAAREHGLALAALHREVRFVAITEAVHGRIIAEQTTALRARDAVHERFVDLTLRGAPADYVVAQLARTLRSTVVLENLHHEVVAVEVDRAEDEHLLTGWRSRSRLVHREAGGGAQEGEQAGTWLVVPVEARGTRWGHLVALPGPSHPAGRRQVLRQGAVALALGRLADPGADEWSRLGQQRLVESLLGGRFSSIETAAAALEAAGLPVSGRRLVGMVVTGVEAAPGDAVRRALRRLGLDGVTGTWGDRLVLLCSVPAGQELTDQILERLARALAREAGTYDDDVAVHVGSPSQEVGGLLDAVHEALALSGVGRTDRDPGPVVRRVERRPLLQLVTALRDDHRLQRHSERVLAPLIEHDLAHHGDLLVVLAALVAHPGNRTSAAAVSHLSRSGFYQRLATIGRLLDVDLEDGEVLTSLHLALLARSVTAPVS